MWERLFGAGIVGTIEDFGTRAEFPSHPELLDWLATEFVRLKWDQKAMWNDGHGSALSTKQTALENLFGAHKLRLPHDFWRT